MNEHLVVISGLALGTFAIRLGGYFLGPHIPSTGPRARALHALPGCVIAALLTIILAQAGPPEWGAATLFLVVALVSRSLPLTMLAGSSLVVPKPRFTSLDQMI